MSRFNQDAMTETFKDTELLIYSTMHKFVAQHGGRFDDVVEYAGEHFVKAYHSYDRERSKFSTWLQRRVTYDLKELYRTRARHNGKVVFTDLNPEAYVAPRQFDCMAFFDQLSQDARLVCTVVFDTPWQMQPNPLEIRRLLWEYLRQPGIGWPAARIRQSFAEIRQALATSPSGL